MRRILPFFGLLSLAAAACHQTGDDSSNSSSAIADDGTSLTEAVSPARGTGPSPNQQVRPALATNGTQFLAAWRECSSASGTFECSIRAGRMDAGGKVLDDVSLAMPHSVGTFDDSPAIAFDGTNYLVVWAHSGAMNGSDPGRIHGARITPAGRVLDSLPLELGSKGGKPAIAPADGGWLVAWTELEAHEIHASLLAADATPIVDDTSLIAVSTTNSPQTLSVAATSSEFLLAWENLADVQSKTEVHAVRLEPTNLGFLDPQPIDVAVENDAHCAYPQIASDGSRFLVTWTGLDGFGDTSGRFVESDGSLGEKNTLATTGKYARIGFDGLSYVLANTSGVSRFDRKSLTFDKFVQGPDVTLFEPPPALATTADGTLVLQSTPSYGDFPDTYEDSGATPIAAILYNRELAPSATIVRPARAPAVANHVVSAQNGDERLVVWHEYRRDWAHAEIRGAIVKNGAIVSGESFLIRGSDERGLTDPSVVFDGTSYAIAWNESINGEAKGVGVAHLDTKGKLIGEPEVRADASDPQVFMAGKDVFVGLKGGMVLKLDIGFVYAANHGLFTVEGPQYQTSVTFDGKDFVAAWLTPAVDGKLAVKTRRYGVDGKATGDAASVTSFVDPNPVVTVPKRFNITAASDGQGKTLIAWDSETSFIDGVVVERDKTGERAHLTPPIPSTLAAHPAIVHAGSEWLLSYETGSAVQLQRFSSSVERTGGAKKLTKGFGTMPSLSSDDKGNTLITYALGGAVTVQAYSYTPGSTNPPPAGDDDDDNGASTPKPKPGDDKADPSSSDSTTPKPADPAAPKSTVSVSAGCSMTSHGDSNGFAMVLLAVGGLAVARRRRNQK